MADLSATATFSNLLRRTSAALRFILIVFFRRTRPAATPPQRHLLPSIGQEAPPAARDGISPRNAMSAIDLIVGFIMDKDNAPNGFPVPEAGSTGKIGG